MPGLEDHDRSGRPREVDHVAVVTATLTPPPKKLAVTHWSTRLLAGELKISYKTVARAWKPKHRHQEFLAFLRQIERTYPRRRRPRDRGAGRTASGDVRRGVFKSVKDLNGKLRAYIEGWNKRTHPFIWTKTADEILKKANRPTISNPRH